jgi:hypothetical protein
MGSSSGTFPAPASRSRRNPLTVAAPAR